jgi:coenzyme F420-reducing hydrogenase delta subunit
MWKKMEQNGLNKERLQLLWASAAEGEKFASKIREMKSIVEKVTPREIEKGKQVFKKVLEEN